jgi:hypothetical protein
MTYLYTLLQDIIENQGIWDKIVPESRQPALDHIQLQRRIRVSGRDTFWYRDQSQMSKEIGQAKASPEICLTRF